MSAPTAARAPQPPILLAVLLLVAIAIGIAATYLSAPVQPLPPNVVPNRASSDPVKLISEGAVGFAAVVLVLLLVFRAVGRGQRGQGRLVTTVVMFFVVAIAFVALAHFLTSGGDLGGLSRQNDSSSGTPPPVNGTPMFVNNSTSDFVFPNTSLPIWLLYLGLAVAAIIAVVVVVPLAQARRAQAQVPPAPIEPVERSMEEALRALEAKGETDPRAAVIALYARLLETVTPYLEHVDTATPREIEQECVFRLHLRPENARLLTGLFEEARYSTHPFTAAQVERARGALRASLADLHRAPRTV